MYDYSACAPGKPVGRHPVRHGSLQWQIPQQVLNREEVIVPRDGVDLPLAEFRQRLRLAPLRLDVPAVDGQDVIGELGRPLEFTDSQRVTNAQHHLSGTPAHADDSCGALLLW